MRSRTDAWLEPAVGNHMKWRVLRRPVNGSATEGDYCDLEGEAYQLAAAIPAIADVEVLVQRWDVDREAWVTTARAENVSRAETEAERLRKIIEEAQKVYHASGEPSGEQVAWRMWEVLEQAHTVDDDRPAPNYAEDRAKLEAAMRAMHDLEPWPLGGTKRVYRPRLPRGVRRHVWREISPPLLGEFCTRCETGRRWWRIWCR